MSGEPCLPGFKDGGAAGNQAAQILEPWPDTEVESVPRCPVCGTDRRDVLFESLQDRVFYCAPGTWTLYKCRACRSAYLDPRPTPQSISRAYRDYYTHEDAGSPEIPPVVGRLATFKARLRNGYLAERYKLPLQPAIRGSRWIVPWCFPFRARSFDSWMRHLPLPYPGARLLDLGAGNGAFVRRAAVIGWQAEGMDPDPAAVDAAKRAGLAVRQGSLPQTRLDADSYDAVTLNHVIEHVHDPLASLAEILRILKPGGKLWIATPNISSPLCRRMKSSWRGLEPPRHLVIFNHESLIQACRAAKFGSAQSVAPSPISKWILTASLQISEGIRFESDLSRRLNFRERMLALWLTTATLVRSRWGEEVVVVAQKPPVSPP
jgi:2-polyprenyl-3-methyl-5-hydroxy-6-metoxy-1,4-benzoquinol methylase